MKQCSEACMYYEFSIGSTYVLHALVNCLFHNEICFSLPIPNSLHTIIIINDYYYFFGEIQIEIQSISTMKSSMVACK